MKSISISRNNYELARALLDKPLLTVGRSPHCDLVLRAKGILPEHFVIKWNGVGDFDPTQDRWSIEDLSSESASHTYLLSDMENICQGFAFKKEVSRYQDDSKLGGRLLRELSRAKPQSNSKEKDLEIVWMTSRGAVKEVLHLSMESLVGHVTTPIPEIPALKIMGIEDLTTSKVELRVLSGALKGALTLINGKDASFEDSVLKEESSLKISWEKEMIFMRMLSRAEVPQEKSQKIEPLFLWSSLLSTLFFFVIVTTLGNLQQSESIVKEEPKLIKIEIPEESEVEEVALLPKMIETEKAISIEPETSREVPVASVPAQTQRESKKSAASGAAPSSGMQGGGRDIAASKVLSLLSKNKLAKGEGLSPKEIANAEVPSQMLSSVNENAALRINRLPGGILGKGKGGAPDGTGEDSGLVAAASTSKLNVEPGATSLGKIGTFGSGKGANFAKLGNGTGNGRGTGTFGTGTGGALFNSTEVAVVGGLDRETVRRVIAGQKGKVQVCYDKALVMNPEIGGRIVYKWKIQPSGNVSATAITKSQVASKVLEGCVASVIKDMLFPKAMNGAITTVIYPFEFFAKN